MESTESHGSESSHLDSVHSSTIHCISWTSNVCLLLFPCKLKSLQDLRLGLGVRGGGVNECKVDVCVKDIRRGPVIIPSITHHCLCSSTSLFVYLICLLRPPFQYYFTSYFISDNHFFALEMNRDHSVIFEIASKYCILDSFVDCEGYSISSKELLPIVLDTMVI